MNNSVTPVLLLTGYLGSGKTTLVNRILKNEKGIKFAEKVVSWDSKTIHWWLYKTAVYVALSRWILCNSSQTLLILKGSIT